MTKNALVIGLLTVAALAPGACGPKKVANPDTSNNDFDSGPDAKRSGATPIPLNKVVPDEVNFDKGDMTDWKSVDLTGKGGILTVELRWENASSSVNVDVFDGYGTSLAGSPDATTPQIKKVTVPIDKAATYFIRITAPRPHDGSGYTVEAKWDGEDAAPPPPPVDTPPPPLEEKRTPHHAKGPKKPHEKKWNGEGGVQGRIVSSYKDGDKMVLHIDKGSAAGVQVGHSGKILDGA